MGPNPKGGGHQSIITTRKRSLGQGNIFIGVCQEFCSQGECPPQCMLGYPPPRADTPRADTPPGADTPRSRHPPGSRHPLEQTPSRADTPPEQTPPRADTPWSRHPPQHRACWEIRSMRGQYASYWIAILLWLISPQKCMPSLDPPMLNKPTKTYSSRKSDTDVPL